MISISETKRNHMGQGLGNTGGEAKQLLFLSPKTCNYCGGMSVGKIDMFKTSGRASFLIILFQFLQYYVFVVLSSDAFSPALNFIVTPSPATKIAYQTFFALKERLAIIGRLLCFVAQILLLTFLMGSK